MTSAAETIVDLLNTGHRTFSFEFFPPKTEAGVETLWETVTALHPLHPDFVSVTYGANGSRRDNTLEVTRRMAASPMRTVGHLTCVSQSRDDLAVMVDNYADAGVRHILAIRGDMPGGPLQPWEQHPEGLVNATELVRLVKSRGDFCVGVAAFPELHPEHRDADLDVRIMCDKAEAGAEFAITQLFFDPSSYIRLVERVRRAGCDLPILAGIMPITAVTQLERFPQMSGAPMPAAIVERIDEIRDDPAAVRQVGIEIAVELAEKVLREGAPGIHLYTQNRSTASAEIVKELKSRGW